MGRFRIKGPGAAALQWCGLRFRSAGESYTFPRGLVIRNTAIHQGSDSTGAYVDLAVLWQVLNKAQTPIRTVLRLYRGFSGVLFEQSFPSGAGQLAVQDLQDVGCAFPVFQPPPTEPPGLEWLSYTYQTWPIPIRGEGWPQTVPFSQWPAAGSDDGVRTPLILFNGRSQCDLLSPLDHPLQQLTVLDNAAERRDIASRPPAVGETEDPPVGSGSEGPRSETGEPRQYPSGEADAGQEPGHQPGMDRAYPLGAPAPTGDSYPSAGVSDVKLSTSPSAGASNANPSSGPSESSNVKPAVTPSPARANPVSPALLVGLEGRLRSLPRGASFRSVLVFGRSGVVDTVLRWGHFLQRWNGRTAQQEPDDLASRVLGYWTDNGAAYYYKTEGNAGYETTLKAVASYHRSSHIPVRYYQLDSWWYPKGWDGGTLLWTPSPTVLPGGLAGISHDLSAPLVLHNRYWSADSPFCKTGDFAFNPGAAVPLQPGFFDRLLKRAISSDCLLYEQDWLGTQFSRVDALQTDYNAPAQWLHAMNDGAAHSHIPIQFCMPSIGFYLAAAGLPSVTQIRTSQDYSRDSWDNVRLRWMEHCQMSLLADAFGLSPFKDVFLTTRHGSTYAGPWEQTEALLSILSRGPVGIGDAFGYTDLDLINRLCLEDGVLAQPDLPALPVEGSVTGAADLKGLPLTLHTRSTVGGQTWHYLLALNLCDTRTLGVYSTLQPTPAAPPQPARFTTQTLGALSRRYVCYDSLDDVILGIAGPGKPVDLPVGTDSAPASYTILAPVQPDGAALIGDVSKYVSLSRARFKSLRSTSRGLEMRLQGPPGSHVRLAVYSPRTKPILAVAGRRIASEPHNSSGAAPWNGFSFHSPPGSSSSFPGIFTNSYARSLYYFSFSLPTSAQTSSVQALLRTR